MLAALFLNQIKQASRVAGLALNSIHKGVHIADDIRNLGKFRGVDVVVPGEARMAISVFCTTIPLESCTQVVGASPSQH